MSDLNKEALAIWESLKPAVDKEIERKTAGTVQRRKVVVSTAPSSLTGLVGVQEPFGVEFFVPYRTEVAAATVGDPVWIEFAYGANNAVAIGMASLVDTGTQTFDDVTITGTLDITPRRCYATLSSAGWYRVIEYDAASSAEVAGDIAFAVDIWLFDWARQYNKITLYGILNSSSLPVGFGDETSKCVFSYLHFDKIRYTRNGSTGYVDVHYNLASTRMMACWFSVKSTWSTGPSLADMQKRFKSIGFTAVADSPTGETVLTTYDFVLNTDDSATVSVGSDANDIVVSGTKLYKHGKIVTGFVKVNTKSISAGAWRNMAVIPSGFRPPYDIDFAGINNSEDTFVHARIFASSGNISIWPTSAIASGKYIYISFTYHTEQ